MTFSNCPRKSSCQPSLEGRLNGYPLGGARAGNFIIDGPAETHRAGGGIQGDRAGVAGGCADTVANARAKRGTVGPQGIGEPLGGIAVGVPVGADQLLWFAHRGLIEGERYCLSIGIWIQIAAGGKATSNQDEQNDPKGHKPTCPSSRPGIMV